MPFSLDAIDPSLLWALAGLSLVLFVGTLLAVPWLVARIPADYFVLPRRTRAVFLAHRPTLRVAFLVLSNTLGAVLVLAGTIMLVLPGQGILTILVGLLMMNFPGKYRLERWVVSFRSVRRAIDYLRRRAGRDPLLFPGDYP